MKDLAVCVHNGNENGSYKETIDSIYKAGFRNVFVQYYHRPDLKYSELEPIEYCKKLGLNILFCHLGYKYIENLWVEGEEGEKVTREYIEDLDLMKKLNINMVCMHLTAKKEYENPTYCEIGLERLRRIVNHGKNLGIKIALENTRRQGYLEYVFENIKEENLGLCLDVGHLHAHFNDEFNWEFFKNKFFAVHIHDNDKSEDQHLIPGEGTINWDDALNKLNKYGYKGPITLELCYRNRYLNMPINEFYKKGYESGIWLERKCKSLENKELDWER